MLRIKNWQDNFENNRTRDLKKMSWIPVPNKQDGDGYTVLVDHEDAAAHLGAWLAILQIASKCDPRGTLVRGNGKPHTPQSLARISHLDAAILQAAIARLLDEKIGWMEDIGDEAFMTIPHEGAVKPHEPARKGRERKKGREGKGKKGAIL